jgi:hypothetical protein
VGVGVAVGAGVGLGVAVGVGVGVSVGLGVELGDSDGVWVGLGVAVENVGPGHPAKRQRAPAAKMLAASESEYSAIRMTDRLLSPPDES